MKTAGKRAERVSLVIEPLPERRRTETAVADRLVFPGLQVQFGARDTTIELSGAIIKATIRVRSRRELIHRLFSIPAVQSLRLDTKRGEVRLVLKGPGLPRRELLSALAAAFRTWKPAPLHLPHEEVILTGKGPRVFEIHRARGGLTLWRVDAPSSRVFRLTHPLLRSDFVRRQVIEELATLSDSVHRSVAIPLVARESLVVFVRPHRMDAALFAEVLDPVLTRCLSVGPAHQTTERRDLLVNSNLVVGSLADLAVPPLGIINIGLTWLLNRAYIPHALSALDRGKFTLELLYLLIAGLTVITYEFLPAAIQHWFMRFWPRRSRELCDSRSAKFLARYRHRSRRVWVEREGLSVETRVEDLSSSSVVTLTAGDIVPGDGTILGGSAQINERLLTGDATHVTRGEGKAIYASTQIVDGSVRIRIHALGEDTASARLADWVRKALEQKGPKVQSVLAAERTVLPVLVTGAAGLIWGGFTAAKAVLRPDYVSGPSVSEEMTGLAIAMRAAHEGILISKRAALEKLVAPDCIVFDDSVRWRTPDLHGRAFAGIARDRGLPEVVFFARGAKLEAERLAASLGFDLFYPDSSTASKLEYIARRQQAGKTVVYVGDCVAESVVARQADLAVEVIEPPYRERRGALVALLAPDLLRFLRLHAHAVEVAREAQTAFRVALVPNVAAVAGALFLRTPVLVSVVLTNLGTLANYLRAGTFLRLTELETRV